MTPTSPVHHDIRMPSKTKTLRLARLATRAMPTVNDGFGSSTTTSASSEGCFRLDTQDLHSTPELATPITPPIKPAELPGSLWSENKRSLLQPAPYQRWDESSHKVRDHLTPTSATDSVNMPFWSKNKSAASSFANAPTGKPVRDLSYDEQIEEITPARIEALTKALAELNAPSQEESLNEGNECDKTRWMAMGRELEKLRLTPLHANQLRERCAELRKAMDERAETILHREAHIHRLYLLLDSQVDYWRREIAFEVTMAKKHHAAEMKKLIQFLDGQKDLITNTDSKEAKEINNLLLKQSASTPSSSSAGPVVHHHLTSTSGLDDPFSSDIGIAISTSAQTQQTVTAKQDDVAATNRENATIEQQRLLLEELTQSHQQALTKISDQERTISALRAAANEGVAAVHNPARRITPPLSRFNAEYVTPSSRAMVTEWGSPVLVPRNSGRSAEELRELLGPPPLFSRVERD
ncbi:MAG: hypothetical protein M1830_005304 [Pleopsidium flavum]|nr:MAG: hypothetical protein M1830_005304 [Pleopsidium flavum]